MARAFGNMLKVVNDLTNTWEANLDAVDFTTIGFLDFVANLNDRWVEAEVTKTMEHSGRNSS